MQRFNLRTVRHLGFYVSEFPMCGMLHAFIEGLLHAFIEGMATHWGPIRPFVGRLTANDEEVLTIGECPQLSHLLLPCFS